MSEQPRRTGRYTCRLIRREMVAEGTLAFYLERPAEYHFTPGQCASVTLLDPPETDELGNTRTLSMASAPSESELRFATRLRDTAFKRVLRGLPVGTQMRLAGPGGSFTLRADPAKPTALLAGGIGITPFFSIVKQTAADQPSRRLVLFYSNRRPEDAAFLAELRALARATPGFEFVPTVTAGAPKAWEGETGRLSAAMLSKHLGDVSAAAYYVAGPPAMVLAMQEMLAAAGVPDSAIRSEDFPGY